ncbi:hypothetical protein [Erwinia sp. V71]|uniref:hypothetical protein n=1 Tax=Erwinia sp. V71 TaxID=3369424 RepID=UPI003F634F96
MSLQSEITSWRADYDQTNVNTYNPAYLGSLRDTDGVYHTGAGTYKSGNNPYDFNIYTGQGVDHNDSDNGGGKYLVTSTNGFSWSTTDANSNNLYEFQSSGSLNTLYLGHTPDNDTGAAPLSGTLTTFNSDYPLIVVTGFNIAIDSVASSVFGVANGNSAIAVSGTFASLLANSSLFESATLNTALLYSLTFDSTTTQAFEFVLDKYLESKGSDITDSFADIQSALSGTGVSISYYDQASDYASGGVVTSAVAQASLAESTSDLLQAA